MAEPMSDMRLAELDSTYGEGGTKATAATKQQLRAIILELLDDARQQRRSEQQARAALAELRALDDENVGSERRPLTKRELNRIGMAVVGPLKYVPERWDHETVVKLYWALMQQKGTAIRVQQELAELREQQPQCVPDIRQLRQAYRAGWDDRGTDITGAMNRGGFHKAEAAAKAYADRMGAPAEQQPEDGDRG